MRGQQRGKENQLAAVYSHEGGDKVEWEPQKRRDTVK
jgi:hypothetical protein